jgi:hypothetical protein
MVADGILVPLLPISVLKLGIPTMLIKDYIPADLGGGFYTAAVDEINKITFGIDAHKLLVPTPPQYTGDYQRFYGYF